jgi:hypothetical protein
MISIVRFRSLSLPEYSFGSFGKINVPNENELRGRGGFGAIMDINTGLVHKWWEAKLEL